MAAQPEPGYRDLDRSNNFDYIVGALDHFDSAGYIQKARRLSYQLMLPRPGARFLDAGCGPGLDVAALSKLVQPGGLVIGLDKSQRMIDLARERYGLLRGIEFRTRNVESTGFGDGYFDATRAMRTIQYCEDPGQAVRELARVTRPGGRVVLIEGGMSTVDLPDNPLRRSVFGPRPGPSIGARLPNLLREAGLVRVLVKPAFEISIGRPDPKTQEYAKETVEGQIQDGDISAEEGEEWLASLEAVIARNAWFSVDCAFVVAGTVPKRR